MGTYIVSCKEIVSSETTNKVREIYPEILYFLAEREGGLSLVP
jgi:hypothetical protein